MDIKKYIYGHCVSPLNIEVFDSYSGGYVRKSVPCGKCLHCSNTHVNEWCTRLIAQKKYSKFCYFVSLDYAPFTLSDPNAYKLAVETAACYHNINKYASYAMHPLVLCKNHLQDFYKRLRKNTNLSIQYFACGEYGTHANGRGFGRPHFHNIIFSNSPIDVNDFQRAWSVNGYSIGRVDVVDMNGLVFSDINENLKIFRYVCKYLQKTDFDFEKLATIDFHRAFFESLYQVSKSNELFKVEFSSKLDELSYDEKKSLWLSYIKQYSPFVVCSRRPSIGSDYLKDNLERFKKQDFRLFGLPNVGFAFPRYFIRKSKESLFQFQTLGSKSEKPSSSARMGNVVSVLSELYNLRLSIENWTQEPFFNWSICNEKSELGRFERVIKSNNLNTIKCRSLNFYDSSNKFLYQFDGYNYNVWAKLKDGTFVLLDKMDIYDVLTEISPSWDRFHSTWISSMHDYSVLSEKELFDHISHFFNGSNYDEKLSAFRQAVFARYQIELSSRYKNKLLSQNSKQNF